MAQLSLTNGKKWSWNDLVEISIRAKQQPFKCTKVAYDSAKCIAWKVVHCACHEANKVVDENIDSKLSEIFCFAN